MVNMKFSRMASSPNQPSAYSLHEVEWRIGRNLLLYQRIEHGLKLVLPLIHPNGSTQGLDAWQEFRQAIKSQTLGTAMKHLSEATKMRGNPEAIKQWQDDLARVVNDRNELAHGLLGLEGNPLVNEAGRQSLCDRLDKNFENASAFSEFVTELVAQAKNLLEEVRKQDQNNSLH